MMMTKTALAIASRGKSHWLTVNDLLCLQILHHSMIPPYLLDTEQLNTRQNALV